jgi:deoxyadenosine/deoxycytidine kinase
MKVRGKAINLLSRCLLTIHDKFLFHGQNFSQLLSQVEEFQSLFVEMVSFVVSGNSTDDVVIIMVKMENLSTRVTSSRKPTE